MYFIIVIIITLVLLTFIYEIWLMGVIVSPM